MCRCPRCEIDENVTGSDPCFLSVVKECLGKVGTDEGAVVVWDSVCLVARQELFQLGPGYVRGRGILGQLNGITICTYQRLSLDNYVFGLITLIEHPRMNCCRYHDGQDNCEGDGTGYP